ncbi:hypothetical protein Tco_0790171 [Tanacetum coccineum]
MASLDHRLNPLFSIKECMTCGALYTADFCCSKGGLEDKILVPKPPQNCVTCGNPVDGLYCRSCAFMPRCLNEGWYTIHDENEILNTSESSNDNTNVTSRENLQAQEDLMKAIQAFLKEYDHIPPNEKCMALLLAEERFLKIKQVIREEQNQPEVMQELLLKLIDDLQILKGSQQEKMETASQSFIPYWDISMIDYEEARDNFLKDVCIFIRKFSRIPFGVTPKNRLLFYFDDDDDEYTVIWRRLKVITPDEPSKEPQDPLIMGEKELSTIPKKDKSSVDFLVQIPSGSKGVSDDIFDNDHSNAESLLSQDISITSPKIDFLFEEFIGKFAPIPPGIDEDKFDEEEVECYDHDISSDDVSYENIEYVDASPLNLEYDNLEEEDED